MDQKRSDLRESFVDLLADRQPASSLTTIAEVVDIMEEHGNAEHLRCLAGAFQRAGDVDPEVKSNLDELFSCSGKLGRQPPGSNSYAVRAFRELEKVLSGKDCVEELGCDPDDLGRLICSHTMASFDKWESIKTFLNSFPEETFAALFDNDATFGELWRRIRRIVAGEIAAASHLK
jgi:hypothetical protein